jgi:hypothetical protein
MLNTYIKNRGQTQTIIYDNNHNHINEINWDADYDGDVANLSLTTNNDGKHKQFDVTLNNHDLAEILNYPSVNTPIHKRLKMDYMKPKYQMLEPFVSEQNIDKLPLSISSPQISEEFIIPIAIDKTTAPIKKHRHHKTHITYKAYKKPKSSRTSHKKSKSRTSRKKYKSRTSSKYSF